MPEQWKDFTDGVRYFLWIRQKIVIVLIIIGFAYIGYLLLEQLVGLFQPEPPLLDVFELFTLDYLQSSISAVISK